MFFGLRNAAIYVTYSFNKLTQWTETKFFFRNLLQRETMGSALPTFAQEG